MGKISEVMYEEVPEDLCTVEQASDYYFYQNVLGLDDMFTESYEKYEAGQARVRAEMFKKFRDEHSDSYPKMNTTLYGASVMKNKVILVAEL